MDYIKTGEVVIYPEQREVRQSHAEDIAKKMSDRGYNPGYPITLDNKGGLVDGGHRLEAARVAGVTELPYVVKPDGVSNVAHAINCNEDGASTQNYDVFDYATHCYTRAESGWLLKAIADELGWGDVATVTRVKNIKTKLSSAAWRLTRNEAIVNGSVDGVVNQELTNVKWQESHFRAIFPHLTFEPGSDKAIMRAQLKTIRAALSSKKVTAKQLGAEAEKYAWHVKLGQYMRDNIAERASITDRKEIVRNIRQGVYGKKETAKNFDRFRQSIAAINERVLGVTLYNDDCLQRIPMLDDNSISLVVTDPPYNVTDNEWDAIGDDEEYLAFLGDFLDTLKPKLAKDFHLFLCVSPQYQARVEVLLVDAGWPLKSRVIWSHRNMSKGRDVSEKFICMWEMVFHCGSHPLNWPVEWDDKRFEVQEFAAPQSNFDDNKVHPTQKPLGLFELFIQVGSKPGDIILDPFAGGGTTGEASKSVSQRQCLLIERDDGYTRIIEARLGIKAWRE